MNQAIAQEREIIEQKIPSLLDKCKEFQVRDPIECKAALDLVRDMTEMQKKWRAYWDPDVKAADAVADSLRAKRDGPIKNLETAKKTLTVKMGAWQQEEDLKRREAERRAQEAARKAEEEARLNEAVALEKEGKDEEAKEVLNTPAPVPVVTMASQVPTGVGVFVKKTWGIRVTDMPRLIQAIFDGNAPSQCVVPDEYFLRKQAQAFKKAGEIYPGVEAFERIGG